MSFEKVGKGFLWSRLGRQVSNPNLNTLLCGGLSFNRLKKVKSLCSLARNVAGCVFEIQALKLDLAEDDRFLSYLASVLPVTRLARLRNECAHE
jgi:hypothetical protein